MIKVLIVDDSASARELLTQILESDAEIQVVASAKNGQEAIELAKKYKPDLITMDVHMPVMNGFEATKEIMIECPTRIIIVSTSAAVGEFEWAMRSLEAGALTLRLKPLGPDASEFDEIARDTIETVKAMAELKVVRHYRRRTPAAEHRPMTQETVRRSKYRMVGIAASTGGPPALRQVLGALPPGFPVPILLVQHIAEGFVEGFAKWLDSTTALHVKVAEEGELLEAGHVYVAPHGKHLGTTRGLRALLCTDEAIGGFRPSATFLFESCANVLKEAAVGIVLTGMGTDGMEGLRTLHANGGRTIVQDEETSVVFGMPGAAIKASLADIVLPIGRIGTHLASLVGAAK